MKTTAVLCVVLTLAVASPNGYYHQEYNYETSASSYKNNELQRHNEDKGFYSRAGDLEGREKPRVNSHSQRSEYVNPNLKQGYERGSSYGQLYAQNNLRPEFNADIRPAGGFGYVGHAAANADLRQVCMRLQEELAREMQRAVREHYQRASAYSTSVSQAQMESDMRLLQEELRRNMTMRLDEAIKSHYGNQGIRGGFYYTIQDGRLQPTANFHTQELEELRRQMEENLFGQLRQQFQTHYRTTVNTERHIQRNTYRRVDDDYPAPIQQRPPVYHPYPPQPIQHVRIPVHIPDSITTVATRVQTELNEHLNRILEDAQRRYFATGNFHNQQAFNYDAILAQLVEELRANITLQFDDQIKRTYGYAASKYSMEDVENLRRQIENNLVTKLTRDFNRQRERYFQEFAASTRIYTREPIPANHMYYPSPNPVQHIVQPVQYQGVGDFGAIQRQMQESLSRQLQDALVRHSYRQAHMYHDQADFNPQSNYQATLNQLTAELNRNLTRQMEQFYHGQNYRMHEAQLAAMRSQLQQDLVRQLQQGLQQSYSRYSSWSSSSSNSHSTNYRPVRGFDPNLYRNYGASDQMVGEDCMMGDDPSIRKIKKRDLTSQQQTEDDDDLTQQVQTLQDEDLTQQVQTHDALIQSEDQNLTQQVQDHDDLTQQVQDHDDLTQQVQDEDLTQQVQSHDALNQQSQKIQNLQDIAPLTQQLETQQVQIPQQPQPVQTTSWPHSPYSPYHRQSYHNYRPYSYRDRYTSTYSSPLYTSYTPLYINRPHSHNGIVQQRVIYYDGLNRQRGYAHQPQIPQNQVLQQPTPNAEYHQIPTPKPFQPQDQFLGQQTDDSDLIQQTQVLGQQTDDSDLVQQSQVLGQQTGDSALIEQVDDFGKLHQPSEQIQQTQNLGQNQLDEVGSSSVPQYVDRQPQQTQRRYPYSRPTSPLQSQSYYQQQPTFLPQSRPTYQTQSQYEQEFPPLVSSSQNRYQQNQELTHTGFGQQQSQDLTQQLQDPLFGQQRSQDLTQQLQDPLFGQQPTQVFSQQIQQPSVGQQQQSQDLTRQLQDPGFAQQGEDLTQQVQQPNFGQSQQLQDPVEILGQQTIDEPGLSQQLEDLERGQQIQDQHFQQLQNQGRNRNHGYGRWQQQQVEDLTQQVEDDHFSNLAQQAEVLTQQQVHEPQVSINKLAKDEPSQQSEDLTQQTEDLTQQTEDLTQQTEDLTQQVDDTVEPQLLSNNLAKDEPSQQSENLTQQTEDLTPQSEDLNQQSENLTDEERFREAQRQSQQLIDSLRNINQNQKTEEPEPSYQNQGYIPGGRSLISQQNNIKYPTVEEITTETVQDIETVEPQTADQVQEVDPLKKIEPTAAPEVPPEPETETTTKKPGFWRRLGSSIKNKAIEYKEKIG